MVKVNFMDDEYKDIENEQTEKVGIEDDIKTTEERDMLDSLTAALNFATQCFDNGDFKQTIFQLNQILRILDEPEFDTDAFSKSFSEILFEKLLFESNTIEMQILCMKIYNNLTEDGIARQIASADALPLTVDIITNIDDPNILQVSWQFINSMLIVNKNRIPEFIEHEGLSLTVQSILAYDDRMLKDAALLVLCTMLHENHVIIIEDSNLMLAKLQPHILESVYFRRFTKAILSTNQALVGSFISTNYDIMIYRFLDAQKGLIDKDYQSFINNEIEIVKTIEIIDMIIEILHSVDNCYSYYKVPVYNIYVFTLVDNLQLRRIAFKFIESFVDYQKEHAISTLSQAKVFRPMLRSIDAMPMEIKQTIAYIFMKCLNYSKTCYIGKSQFLGMLRLYEEYLDYFFEYAENASTDYLTMLNLFVFRVIREENEYLEKIVEKVDDLIELAEEHNTGIFDLAIETLIKIKDEENESQEQKF